MMNNNPLVSIVTVSYNAAATIEQTILSVLNQSYSNIEYIIIDGGSTDGTVDIIKKYSDKLAYWVSEPDKGIYDAMNKGILKASGDWINFMNSGDFFISFNTVEKLIRNDYKVKILYGNIIRCYDTNKIRATGITELFPSIFNFINDTIHHQSAFISKELFEKYGLYSTEYKLMSDWKFFFEVVALNKEPILYVNQDIAYFQMDGASTKNVDLYLMERRLYLQKLLGNDLYENLWKLHLYETSLLSRISLDIKLFFKKNKIFTFLYKKICRKP